MLFRCKNCNGNMVYSPEKGTMYCPFCSGENTEESIAVPDEITCPNCGGQLSIPDVTSACKCVYCGSYLILDKRVNGQYKPHLILPFKLGKEQAKELLHREFDKKIFAPDDFLSELKLSTIEGVYVPFFMYSFHTDTDYMGDTTTVRSWTTGNRRYTETSFYHVTRKMRADFSRIPVDASVGMNNQIMDLMEPYDYQALEDFQEKYMSGFFAERYSETPDQLDERAKEKANSDADALIRESLSRYGAVTTVKNERSITRTNTEYALLPVWVYTYQYKDQFYSYHVNGQTGKVIGKAPVSQKKVWIYSIAQGVFILLMGLALNLILGV